MVWLTEQAAQTLIGGLYLKPQAFNAGNALAGTADFMCTEKRGRKLNICRKEMA